MRPSVVLPLPLSPTTPRVSPARTVSQTPSTAVTALALPELPAEPPGVEDHVAGPARGGRTGRVHPRTGSRQLLGVRLTGRREDVPYRPALHRASVPDHQDLVGALRRDAHVMGDQEQPHAGFLPQRARAGRGPGPGR
ncbi:hypothetical protein SALBM135S_04999 [Streptomyces alboniger]